MGLFDFLKKSTSKSTLPGLTHQPYREPATNLIYNLLFCDMPELYRPGADKPFEYPFDILFSENNSAAGLQKIIDDANADPRIRLLAYNKQRTGANPAQNKELLGVVVELGLDTGPDVLASFQNGTARYINQTGKVLVWENTEDARVRELKQELFERSWRIVHQIGPWDKPRKPAPAKGNARLSFLVSDGLYFGEAAIDVLFQDQMASPVLATATELMQYITRRSLEKGRRE